jgi:threonine/homoserine/homoserine lactone efflux protein
MDKLLRPASILLYIITIIVFFFIGGTMASIFGNATKEGFTGGAVVLMYGVIFAFIALLIALLLAYSLSKDTIKNITKVLALVLLGYIIYFIYKTNLIHSVDVKPIKTILMTKQNILNDKAEINFGYTIGYTNC